MEVVSRVVLAENGIHDSGTTAAEIHPQSFSGFIDLRDDCRALHMNIYQVTLFSRRRIPSSFLPLKSRSPWWNPGTWEISNRVKWGTVPDNGNIRLFRIVHHLPVIGCCIRVGNFNEYLQFMRRQGKYFGIPDTDII